jgi:hypothetical protein
MIDRERRGPVAVKEPVPDHEGQVSLGLLGWMSVGLWIGVALSLSGARRDRGSLAQEGVARAGPADLETRRE